jgi:hypothetical protein
MSARDSTGTILSAKPEQPVALGARTECRTPDDLFRPGYTSGYIRGYTEIAISSRPPAAPT